MGTAADLALRFVPEERAMWHLELLGAYDPAEACVPGVFADERDYPDEWDEDEDEFACTHCGGEGYVDGCDIFWDDCDEFGYGPCKSCRGTGERRHQWVF
jgi:hypothetical protein